MNFKYLYILFFFLGFSKLQAQLWPGSLGDPLLNIDFGLGDESSDIRGVALGPTITSYAYSSSGELENGQYSIAKSTSGLKGTDWHITSDHTGNPEGYMMVVNSSSVASEQILYTQKIYGLCPETTFQFSAWIMNLMDAASPNPNVSIRITTANGILLDTYNTGDIPSTSSPLWREYAVCFNAGSATDIVITIVNSSSGSALAIDDITIKPCGPLVSLSIEGESETYIQVCRSDTTKSKIIANVTYVSLEGLPEYNSSSYRWQVSPYHPSVEVESKWVWIGAVAREQLVQPNNKEGYFKYRLSLYQYGGSRCSVYSNEITIRVFERTDRVTIETIQPTCEVPTGTITVTYPTDNATYSIDGKKFQSSPVFSGLIGGNYNISVKETSDDCAFADIMGHINSAPISDVIPTFDVLQPVSCTNPLGTITITSVDNEYSFDNGATWSTNNVKSGLPVGDYLIKTRVNSSCETNAVSVSILLPPDSPLTPTVAVTQPDCLVQTGTITVSDVATEYSFDNGLTWTTSNSKSNLVAGKYKLLLKNTLGCVSYVAKEVEIKAYINSEPLPLATTPQQFCVQQNATLSNVTITGTNLKWYDAANGNLIPATTILQSGTYYATQTVSICESERIPITINIQNTSTPTGVSIQDFCTTQKPTIASLAATGTNVKWYNAATNGTVFPTATALVDGVTYYATQMVNGCESANRLAVLVSIVLPSIAVNNVTEIICDDKNDGSELVDFASYQSRITPNTTVTFTYFKSLAGAENRTVAEQIKAATNYILTLGTTAIYVRIDSNDKCYQVVKLSLTLVSKPIIPISDSVILCENKDVTIDAGFGFDSYLWSTGATSESIIVDKVGSYSVTVTQNHGNTVCSTTKSFSVVLSNGATISEIKIQDWTDNENIITVEITDTSIGNYEYSLNGITYQESNTFTGLPAGNYLVYVRDKNGCGITNQEVFLLSYPKYFTPNGDGYNDTWGVKFSESEPGLNIKIFNRYGKLIKELNATSTWDGTFNGHELPSADYWFVITRANGKVSKGHFAMKR